MVNVEPIGPARGAWGGIGGEAPLMFSRNTGRISLPLSWGRTGCNGLRRKNKDFSSGHTLRCLLGTYAEESSSQLDADTRSSGDRPGLRV